MICFELIARRLTSSIKLASLACFELPVVIVTPTKDRLPDETCNQMRAPALDCMREPVAADIEVIDNDDGVLNCLKGNRTAIYPASVHYRGQSSLHFAKHSISVNLAQPAKLLGFPSDKTYVLHGPTIDGSLIRNHLAHWLFRGTQRYSPRTRHIVVFIRDALDVDDSSPQYHGIYLAMEKISYGPNRVGLTPLDPSCETQEELSGGWAWENNPLMYGVNSPNLLLDKYETLFGSGERPILNFPSASKMTQKMRDYFVSPETGPLPRLYHYLYENMTQPDQLQDHIDIGSFVDYLLHTELSQNSDAYRRSAYFFKDRGQPINAGPVWDFNLAYGRGANQQDWLFKPHTFWRRIMCNYQMAALAPKRWRQLRADVWSDDTIRGFIDASAAPLAKQLANCTDAWRSRSLQCANVKVHGTFDEHIQALKRAVTGRAYWMDQHVGSFFAKLDHLVCVVAGDLPEYNCARNGSDGGCLATPQKYLEAIEFPPIRQPSTPNTTDNYACSSKGGDIPTVDHCWLSAGVYVAEGTLTPFCSGYGFCPPGPGAKCTCNPGHNPPSCMRSDAPIARPGRSQLPELGEVVQPVAVAAKHTHKPQPEYSFVVFSAVCFVILVALFTRKRRIGERSILHPSGIRGNGAQDNGGLHSSSLPYGT